MSAFETDPTELRINEQVEVARRMTDAERSIRTYAEVKVLRSEVNALRQSHDKHLEKDDRVHADLGNRIDKVEGTESRGRGAIAGISFVLGTGLLGIIWAAVQMASH